MLDDILSMHSVDAVEVVRCKDCKHQIFNNYSGTDGSKIYNCRKLKIFVKGDFFCK
jgi:hypothetical protein